MNKLPELPSALLNLALDDLDKVEKMKDTYVVDMHFWHRGKYSSDDKCIVCLAGSVLAMELGVSPDTSEGDDFGDKLYQNQLIFLDEIRYGYIAAALREFHLQPPTNLPTYAPVANYTDSPEYFKQDLRYIAVKLAQHGL